LIFDPEALVEMGYAVHNDVIYIAAVMHLRRKPDYWNGRRMTPGERRADRK
jgi:hypothetical protein